VVHFADAVECEDGGLLERAGKECTGSVALVMVEEEEGGPGRGMEPAAYHPAHAQLLFQPQRHGHAEAAEPAWGEGEEVSSSRSNLVSGFS